MEAEIQVDGLVCRWERCSTSKHFYDVWWQRQPMCTGKRPTGALWNWKALSTDSNIFPPVYIDQYSSFFH